MNVTQEKALSHMQAKLDIGYPTVEAWQQVVDRYPYFAPARFFLAGKLKSEENALAVSHLVRTNLYFTNPYWLQLQLHEAIKVEETFPTEIDTPTGFREEMAIPTVEAVKQIMRNIDNAQMTADEPEELLTDEYAEEEALPLNTETENKIASVLSNQLADFKKPVEPDARLDIDADKERMHTIDYFASQGIKIDLSSIPQDKLTAHLRKFTDWLKQMKNVNASTSDLGTNVEMEKAVMETAQNSNETREVLTEAMADVLEKQGQTDKAIQLYIKLSFLNPEKSSYFAAKIEQLKGI
jgi:hypothetical protein